MFVCLKDFLEREKNHDEVNECKGDHVDGVWEGPAHIIECSGEGVKGKGETQKTNKATLQFSWQG